MPLQIALRIASQICAGLHAAHELVGADGAPLGLVHRDVSPSNILVGFDGVARVTDFGIAKALGQSSRTAAGVIKGKISYAAPEQLRFEPLDRRSDLFSFGIVLYELVASAHPFGTDPTSRARAMLHGEVPDLGVVREDAPPPLVELMYELLAGDPALRPPDARAVQRRLDALVSDLAIVEGPLDVADYMERVFSETREKNARARIEAARAPAPAPEASAPKVDRRPVALGLALGALAIAGSIAATFFVLESTRAERLEAPLPPVSATPEPLALDAGPPLAVPEVAADTDVRESAPRRPRTKRAPDRDPSRAGGPPLWQWE
jgi:eukaryotic-like serine/threonine-protein kinase